MKCSIVALLLSHCLNKYVLICMLHRQKLKVKIGKNRNFVPSSTFSSRFSFFVPNFSTHVVFVDLVFMRSQLFRMHPLSRSWETEAIFCFLHLCLKKLMEKLSICFELNFLFQSEKFFQTSFNWNISLLKLFPLFLPDPPLFPSPSNWIKCKQVCITWKSLGPWF